MQKKSLKSILARQPLLKGLKDSYLELLTGCAANVSFPAGRFLFRNGEVADRFYLIRRGRVSVEIPVAPRNVVVKTLGVDEILGWSWLIPPYRWHLDARAIEPVVALSFDGKCIRGKFDQDPELGYEFSRRFSVVMSQRMEETLLQLVGLCR